MVDEELLLKLQTVTRGRGRVEETISINYLDLFAKISFVAITPTSLLNLILLKSFLSSTITTGALGA